MNMRTMLARMAPRTLDKIVRDMGFAENKLTPQGKIDALARYFADYRLRVADVKARYPELKDDAGLRD
jgi:hypothetical protein